MSGNRRLVRIALSSVGLLLATVSVPAPLAAQTSWKDLSPAERYDALQNYQHHKQLPEDRQRAVEQGYERWRHMSPDERARVRRNYERFQRLPPKDREQFERKYEKWREQRGAPPQ